MLRRIIPALTLLFLSSCAHHSPIGARSAPDSPCRNLDLSACEAGLAKALATDSSPAWIKAYVDARADGLGPKDPWVVVHDTLKTASNAAVVVFIPAGKSSEVEKTILSPTPGQSKNSTEKQGVIVVEVPALPSLETLAQANFMLALATHSNIPQVAWFHDHRAWRVLGHDPIASLTFHIPPIVTHPFEGEQATQDLAHGISFDRTVNDAMALLAKGNYQDAARLALDLDQALQSESSPSVSSLRARWFLAQASSFGTQFPKRDKAPFTLSELWKQATPTESAYCTWFRILLSDKDSHAAWSQHRSKIAEALPAHRLDLLDKLYNHDPVQKKQRCETDSFPDSAWSGELFLARKLASEAITGKIDPSQWASAYDALVAETQRTGTAWAMLPSLLFERGELPGMSARGSKTYDHVTHMAVDHLSALEAFQKASPDSYAFSGQLSIAVLPQAHTDPEIAKALHRLVTDNVKYKLAPAATADDLLSTTLMMGIMGIAFPEPTRSAYFVSLQQELKTKLKTSFGDAHGGWSLAGLYTLDLLASYVLGQNPDFAHAADGITRALESEGTAVKPLAHITARGVQYGSLIASKELEADRVGALRYGPGRQAARDRLQSALRNLGDSSEGPSPTSLGNLTTLIDGLIATTALVFEHSSKDKESDACSADVSSRNLPEVKKNVRVLTNVRDALLRDPGLRDGKTSWNRRALILVLLASDLLDSIAASENEKPVFAFPPTQARIVIEAALGEWTSVEIAKGVASLHALARDFAVDEDKWQHILANKSADLGSVMKGVMAALGPRGDTQLLSFVLGEGVNVIASSDTTTLKDSAPKIVQLARTHFASSKSDHGTMALLLAGVLGKESTDVLQQAIEVGLGNDSPATWYLLMRAGLVPGHALEMTSYEKGLRSITDDHCQIVRVEPLIEVGRAVQSYRSGQGKSSTDRLDQVLDRAEEQGLSIPRINYVFTENLESDRVFRISMHLTTGQGFIHENGLSMGLDVFGNQSPRGLTVDIPSATPDDAGRFYAHIASLNSIYHFLDGRDGPGVFNAERMLDAVVSGVRLGESMVVASDHKPWLEDLDPSLELTALLASQRGHILLSGDLWSLAFSATPKRPAGSRWVDPTEGWDWNQAPIGIRSIQALRTFESTLLENKRLVDRAASCDPKQRPRAPTNLETCQAYRQAISLWRAGVYQTPPAMGKGAREACTREASLVETLEELDASPQSPLPPRSQDKLANLILASIRQGSFYDATQLLRKAQDHGLCTQALVTQARQMGRHPNIISKARVDWLGYSLSCPGRQIDASFWEDLEHFAMTADRTGDPQLSYRVHSSVIRYLVGAKAWDRLLASAQNDAFVALMNRGGPSSAATSLLIRDAAAILAGKKPDVEKSRPSYEIACIRYGDTGREQVCRQLGTLRNRIARENPSQLAPVAEGLLRQLVGL